MTSFSEILLAQDTKHLSSVLVYMQDIPGYLLSVTFCITELVTSVSRNNAMILLSFRIFGSLYWMMCTFWIYITHTNTYIVDVELQNF